MADVGSIYILDSANTYLMEDANTYNIDTIPLPDGWLEDQKGGFIGGSAVNAGVRRHVSGKSLSRTSGGRGVRGRSKSRSL